MTGGNSTSKEVDEQQQQPPGIDARAREDLGKSNIVAYPKDTTTAATRRPRFLALCGARSNNDVTKLQLANLGINSEYYDIFYLHGPIKHDDNTNDNDNDIVDGLVQGPFYSWIDDSNSDALNETIINSVRLVLRVVEKYGPFEMVYGFSNGKLYEWVGVWP